MWRSEANYSCFGIAWLCFLHGLSCRQWIDLVPQSDDVDDGVLRHVDFASDVEQRGRGRRSTNDDGHHPRLFDRE
jgi:hypothetical protein